MEQHRHWLEGLHAAQAGCSGSKLIHELFEQQARESPDAIALVYEGQQLSYAELNRRTNRVAHCLREMGVRPDDRVAICIERCIGMVVGLLGILKAGGAYVPLVPAYPKEWLRHMLVDSDPVVLLTQRRLMESLPLDLCKAVLLLDEQGESKLLASQAEHDLAAREIGLTSRHLAYVIYASDSPGLPRGVMIEHRSVVNFLWAMASRPGIHSADAMLATTALTFDVAGLELFLPFLCGAKVILAGSKVAADPVLLAGVIEACYPTIVQATPAMWRMLSLFKQSLPPILKIFSAGGALPRGLAEQLKQMSASVWHMYGAVETTIWSASHNVPREPDSSVRHELIGRPIANSQIYILDSNRQPVPVGATGEIHVGGAGVARGYLNRPELTAERFLPDPFSDDPHARMYKTGDSARRLEDGDIECLRRNRASA